MTVEQKCDIATRELDELRDEQQRKRGEYERARDNHKAVVDEADIRLADIKKAQYEFDRDIVRGALNPVGLLMRVCVLQFSKALLQRTGKIMGEKVVRYFEERVKAKVSVCTWASV